jgi:hypothetical protein
MPYGGVKFDNITFTNAGVDANITVSGLYASTTSGLTVTGTVLTGSGSAAAPSHSFTNDPNTGLFNPAADTLAFAEGGVEAMRIDSSGNLGIGTSTPAGVLHIATANTRAILLNNSTIGTTSTDGTYITNNTDGSFGIINQENSFMRFGTNGAETMRFDSFGRLLVGTSTARSNFSIDGTGYAPLAQLGDASSVLQASFVRAVSPFIGLAASNAAASETNTGNISFFGNDGTNLIRTAQINSVVDGTPGTNDMPGRLVFSTTADGAASPTERMRIDSSGRVGIGTSAPLRNLSVVGTGYTGTINISDTSGGSAYGMLSLGAHGTAANDVGMWRGSPNQILGGNSLNLGCRDNIVFAVGAADLGSQTERLRIDSSGRLLVGTSTANTSGAKLQTSDGLTFPATQVASADPNTLDDYEEGTWTPTIAGSGTAGTVTYVARAGQYTKIGNTVQAHVYVDWNSGASGTGDLRITGLPFTNGNPNNVYCSCAIGAANNITLTASNYMQAHVAPSTAYVTIAQSPVGGGASTNVSWDAAGYIILTAIYVIS